MTDDATHDLPAGWAWSQLQDVSRLSSGGTPKSSTEAFYDGDIPWAIIGDLDDGPLWRTARCITAAGLDASSCKWVEPDTVLVAMYGSIGKLGIAKSRVTTNQAIAACAPERGVKAGWLFWYLMSQRSALMAAGKGGTQNNISQTVLKPWPIPVAPSDEQGRVLAAIETQLSRLDDALRSLDSAAHRLKLLEVAILHTLTTTGTTTASLSEVAEVSTGPALTSSRFLKGDNLGIRLLRGNNIEPGALRWGDDFTVCWPSEGLDDLDDLMIAEGDLLLAMDRPVISTGFKLARAASADLPAAVIQRVARIRAEGTQQSWLSYVLAAPAFRIHLLGDVTGTQLPHITLQGIRDYQVPILDETERAQRVAELDRYVSLVGRLKLEIASARLRADRLRHSILKAAFEGKLAEQDPTEEPAEELLERIAEQRAEAAALAKATKKANQTSKRAASAAGKAPQ